MTDPTTVKPNAAERWDRYQEVHENDQYEDGRDSFALRADGAMVFFDEDGYFALKWLVNEQGEPDKIMAYDETGEAFDVYCEPVWLATFYDEFSEDL